MNKELLLYGGAWIENEYVDCQMKTDKGYKEFTRKVHYAKDTYELYIVVDGNICWQTDFNENQEYTKYLY